MKRRIRHRDARVKAVRPSMKEDIEGLSEEEDIVCGECEGAERKVGALSLPELPKES